MDKLQFLVLIFAVLLSKLCNVSLYNYKVYLSSFSIFREAPKTSLDTKRYISHTLVFSCTVHKPRDLRLCSSPSLHASSATSNASDFDWHPAEWRATSWAILFELLARTTTAADWAAKGEVKRFYLVFIYWNKQQRASEWSVTCRTNTQYNTITAITEQLQSS